MNSSTEECFANLLNSLKMTVENILVYHAHNTWSTYGDTHRLHKDVIAIFKHGFRFLKDNGEPDFWVFIQGLSWLQPTLAASPSFLGYHTSPVRNADKAMAWIYKSIENHTLSEKLSWLLSDDEHLKSCYKPTAFFRQPQYSETALICLQAVEQRQLSLLTKIDPVLYQKKKPIHRRSSSYPEPKVIEQSIRILHTETEDNHAHQSNNSNIFAEKSVRASDSVIKKVSASFKFPLNPQVVNPTFKFTNEEENLKDAIKQRLLKKAFSTSDLYLIYYKGKISTKFFTNDDKMRNRSRRRSFSETSYSEDNDSNSFLNLLHIKYDNKDSNSFKKKSNFVPPIQSSDSTDSLSTVTDSSTLPSSSKKNYKHKKRRRSSLFRIPFRIWEESDDENQSACSDDSKTLVFGNTDTNSRKSFIENGGSITLPMAMGSFAKPSPGQSIMSFLSSGVFTNTNAELDRENAHFHVCEAMIAILEQVKFDQQLKLMDEILEESDEEINHLKRIIRIRRTQKQNKKHFNNLAEINDPFSSEATDATVTTDQSVNSLSSSVYSTSESISTDVDEEENDKKINSLQSVKKAGLSVSKTSVYSANLKHTESNSSISAESVAISLLRRFKENQLPAASEIEWLVSEIDAPQKILPLPNKLPANDEIEENTNRKSTLLRGTEEWAPPRPQIIFTAHPSPVRRQLMEKQDYRCAGCGTKVIQKYASKFRYCEYLGRYFCTGCHNEQKTVIPGRIISKWDFSKYPVSNFSFRLLDKMSTDPLFNVMDLNPVLYNRIRDLQKTRLLRVSLFYLKDFIFNCKYTDNLQDSLKSVQPYIYNDPDSYSISNFIQVKSGKLYKTLAELVKVCENHVKHCELCQARGFMCEICGKRETIFPWELNVVIRCSNCGSCHHIKCYQQKKLQCPRCIRMNSRHGTGTLGGLRENIT